jgi:hypothetical protein
MDKYFQSDSNRNLIRSLTIKALERNKYYNPENVSIDIDYFLSQKMYSIFKQYNTTYQSYPPEQYITEMNKRVLEELIPQLIGNYKRIYEDRQLQKISNDSVSSDRYSLLNPNMDERLTAGTDDITRFMADRGVLIKPQANSLAEMFNLKTRINGVSPPSDIRPDINQDIMTNDSLLREVAAGYEKTYRMRDKKEEHVVIIDSRDRDRTVYPAPAYYVVALNATDTTAKPHLSRGFKNVLTVEVLEITLPIAGSANTPFDRHPYLLLQIDELDNTLDGTNTTLRKSIAKIYPKDIRGNDWVHVTLNYRKIYNRNTLGNLNKLTVRIVDPDGNLFDFGDDNGGSPDKYLQNALTLRITTLEPEVDDIINRQ